MAHGVSLQIRLARLLTESIFARSLITIPTDPLGRRFLQRYLSSRRTLHEEPSRMRSFNKIQVLVGCSALFLGFLLYLLHRPLDTYFVFFIKAHDASSYGISPSSNAMAGALPSFLHVFAFSLIIGGLLSCRKRGYLIICFAWLFINVLFEIGQKHAVASSEMIPVWFGKVFVLENMQNYFLRGTFDFFDLLASFAGALAAYSILALTSKNKRE